MVRTRALILMVSVALLALGALGGCSGSVGGNHPGTREVSGLDMRTGGEPVRVHAYLEQGGHYYDLTAGEALSGAGGERVSAESAVESVANREWLPYPPDIAMFQEVVVPSIPPVFESWKFNLHQVAAQAGRVWDPTFLQGDDSNPIKVIDWGVSTFFNQILAPQSPPAEQHPETQIGEVIW